MATVLQETPPNAGTTRLPAPKANWPKRLSYRPLSTGMAWLVLAISIGLALPVYAYFWEHSREIWYGIVHDRSSHYLHGVDLAMDLRFGNLPGLMHHLDRLRMWGPLHAVVSAPIQALFGPDYRLGVLPSWLAWIGTSLLGFLLARRMVPAKDSWGGNIAGLTTALFILASPAHRAFATDVMLESMGACLTLWCLYQYVVAVQSDYPRRGIWLGVALTALFLLKTNYWMLMMFGLTLTELTRQPRVYLAAGRNVFTQWQPRAWLMRQLWHPLTYLFLLLVGLSGWIVAAGGLTFHIWGRDISLAKPHNAVLLAYMVFFVRMVQWWRSPAVRAYWQTLAPAFRQAVGLHGWAVAIYFLFPQRLANFIWYMSPANNDQHRESLGFLHGAPYYAEAMWNEYHVAGWSLLAALGLLVMALATCRSWRPGSSVVFWFLAISTLLTFQHPMLKTRFVHSWIATEWVLAGVGLVGAISLLRQLPSRAKAFASVALLGLIAAHAPFLLAPGHAYEGGMDSTRPNILPVAEAYLPSLQDAKDVTFVSNMPIRDFVAWTYQEKYRRQTFSTDIKKLGADAGADQDILKQWLKATHSDRIVLVEVFADSPYFTVTIENRDMTPLRTFLAGQTSFQQESDQTLPQRVRVTVWRR